LQQEHQRFEREHQKKSQAQARALRESFESLDEDFETNHEQLAELEGQRCAELDEHCRAQQEALQHLEAELRTRVDAAREIGSRFDENWAARLERQLTRQLATVPGARASCHPDRDSCKRRRARGEACRQAEAEVGALDLEQRALAEAQRELERTLGREHAGQGAWSESLRDLTAGNLDEALERLDRLEHLQDEDDAGEESAEEPSDSRFDFDFDFDDDSDDAQDDGAGDSEGDEDSVSWAGDLAALALEPELGGAWVLVEPGACAGVTCEGVTAEPQEEQTSNLISRSIASVTQPLAALTAVFPGVEAALAAMETVPQVDVGACEPAQESDECPQCAASHKDKRKAEKTKRKTLKHTAALAPVAPRAPALAEEPELPSEPEVPSNWFTPPPAARAPLSPRAPTPPSWGGPATPPHFETSNGEALGELRELMLEMRSEMRELRDSMADLRRELRSLPSRSSSR
jgi:hypothetical protein